ncbi:MAG: plasmid stabilization system [Sphingobacteriaceae bacterium]|nr:plasmid stabilization system [Sphingobacteriaceae bacterium]
MANPKIIWSNLAEDQLYQILGYYEQRNGHADYSLKLLEEVEKRIENLLFHQEMGRLTSNKTTRVILLKQFAIFYEPTNDCIHIVSFWDLRQDPAKNKVK